MTHLCYYFNEIATFVLKGTIINITPKIEVKLSFLSEHSYFILTFIYSNIYDIKWRL